MSRSNAERRSAKGLPAFLLAAILCAGGGLGILYLINHTEPIVAEVTEQTTTTVQTETTAPQDPNSLVCANQSMFVSDIASGSLVLVNADHETADLPADKLVSVYEKRGEHVHVRDTKVLLQQEAIDAFNQLADGFFAATGKDDLTIMNGYRTRDDQQRLFKANPETAAAGGHSDYETGLALELRLMQNGRLSDFDGTGDYKWVLDHAAEYGFVVRFPEGKKAQTGYDYAPAHLRYVGIPHASFMVSHEMCLEEYLKELDDHLFGTLNLPVSGADGAEYIVYKYRVGNSTDVTVDVPVPTELPYTVSGDHIDGFIIAAVKAEKVLSNDTSAVTTVSTDAQQSASGTTTTAVPIL